MNIARYSSISAPWWDEVWIVAGGPSALRFDVRRLRGETLLGVNDGIDLILPYAAAVFSLDNRWIRRRRGFLESFTGEKYFALPLDTWPDCSGISGSRYLQWSHEGGLSDDPCFLCTGGNSGYAAINLACLKRAKTIHLIGYDMNPRECEHYEHWAPAFCTMLPQLRARGVEVINHNPDSHIDAFPRVFGVGAPA